MSKFFTLGDFTVRLSSIAAIRRTPEEFIVRGKPSEWMIRYLMIGQTEFWAAYYKTEEEAIAVLQKLKEALEIGTDDIGS